MKVKFKFCCYEKVVEYVEQTPLEIIEKDLKRWVDKMYKSAKWEYYL